MATDKAKKAIAKGRKKSNQGSDRKSAAPQKKKMKGRDSEQATPKQMAALRERVLREFPPEEAEKAFADLCGEPMEKVLADLDKELLES